MTFKSRKCYENAGKTPLTLYPLRCRYANIRSNTRQSDYIKQIKDSIKKQKKQIQDAINEQ